MSEHEITSNTLILSGLARAHKGCSTNVCQLLGNATLCRVNGKRARAPSPQEKAPQERHTAMTTMTMATTIDRAACHPAPTARPSPILPTPVPNPELHGESTEQRARALDPANDRLLRSGHPRARSPESRSLNCTAGVYFRDEHEAHIPMEDLRAQRKAMPHCPTAKTDLRSCTLSPTCQAGCASTPRP